MSTSWHGTGPAYPQIFQKFDRSRLEQSVQKRTYLNLVSDIFLDTGKHTPRPQRENLLEGRKQQGRKPKHMIIDAGEIRHDIGVIFVQRGVASFEQRLIGVAQRQGLANGPGGVLGPHRTAVKALCHSRSSSLSLSTSWKKRSTSALKLSNP
jgi:hypothetical protein